MHAASAARGEVDARGVSPRNVRRAPQDAARGIDERYHTLTASEVPFHVDRRNPESIDVSIALPEDIIDWRDLGVEFERALRPTLPQLASHDSADAHPGAKHLHVAALSYAAASADKQREQALLMPERVGVVARRASVWASAEAPSRIDEHTVSEKIARSFIRVFSLRIQL